MKKVYVVAGDWEEKEYPTNDHAHFVYGIFDTEKRANEVLEHLQKLLSEASDETIYVKEYELNSTTEDLENTLELY